MNLVETENNALRTYYHKAKIDYTPKYSKPGLYGNRDETVNHKVSESGTRAEKE